MDFRIVVHRACESHAMDCPTSFRGIKSVGLCAGDEIRTRNTCLEGRCDDLFTTPAVRGIELWLFTGKHYMHEMVLLRPFQTFRNGRLATATHSPAESEGFEPSNRMKRLTP